MGWIFPAWIDPSHQILALKVSKMEIHINAPVTNKRLKGLLIVITLFILLSTGALNGKAIFEWLYPKQEGSELFESLIRRVRKLEQRYAHSAPGCYGGKCTNGKGVWVYPTRDIYYGEFLDGLRNGTGIYIYKNHPLFDYFSGTFLLDRKNGEGIFRYKDGSWYKGEVMDGERHGYGIQYNAEMELMQKGCWRENRLVKPNVRCDQ